MESQNPLDKYVKGKEIFVVLNSIKTGSNTPLRLALYSKSFDIKLSDIQEALADVGITIKVKVRNDTQTLWELSVDFEKEENTIQCPKCKHEINLEDDFRYRLETYLLEVNDIGVVSLVTNDKAHFENIMGRISITYPLLNKIMYQSSDLRTLFRKLADLQNVEVIGRKCVVKRQYDEKKTVVTYEESTIEGFYERARKENAWVDSIEATVNPLGILGFSRHGEILYAGARNFAAFYDIIVKTVQRELISKRRERYTNRARTQERKEIRPVIMKFEKNYFADLENIQKLVRVLNGNDKFELSVLYMYEGLAHIDLYDYANGSGVDIFINDESQLNIVPQTQVTASALELIVLTISEVFEGTVE